MKRYHEPSGQCNPFEVNVGEQQRHQRNYSDIFKRNDYAHYSLVELESYHRNLLNYLRRLFNENPQPEALILKLSDRLEGLEAYIEERREEEVPPEKRRRIGEVKEMLMRYDTRTKDAEDGYQWQPLFEQAPPKEPESPIPTITLVHKQPKITAMPYPVPKKSPTQSGVGNFLGLVKEQSE